MLDLVFNILNQCNAAGIKIKVICTDQASDNQALWGLLGIFATRRAHNVLFKSPCNPDENLIFMPDPPHAIKNLKGASMQYEIKVPQWLFEKYGLTDLDPLTTTVKLKQTLKQLVQIEKANEVEFVKGLEECLEPGGYEKMRMHYTLTVVNYKVVAAIESCVEDGIKS